jgi:hypothetical protein
VMGRQLVLVATNTWQGVGFTPAAGIGGNCVGW